MYMRKTPSTVVAERRQKTVEEARCCDTFTATVPCNSSLCMYTQNANDNDLYVQSVPQLSTTTQTNIKCPFVRQDSNLSMTSDRKKLFFGVYGQRPIVLF